QTRTIQRRRPMPEKEVTERAQKDAEEGKSPSTQAGEFVHEEIRHIREGKHGARSTKQAIAIGLSKARRAGVKLPASAGPSRATRRGGAAQAGTGTERGPPGPARSGPRAAGGAPKQGGGPGGPKRAPSKKAPPAAGKAGGGAPPAGARKGGSPKGPRQR